MNAGEHNSDSFHKNLQQTDADAIINHEPDFFDKIELIVHFRWLIFLCVIVGAIIAFLYVIFTPETYQAHASILPGKEEKWLEFGVEPNLAERSKLYTDRYIERLKSIRLNREMVQSNFTYKVDNKIITSNLLTFFETKSVESATNQLLKAAEFEAKGDVIYIFVKTGFPDLSAAIANEYVHHLQIFGQEETQKRNQEKISFIESRLAEIQKELNETEKAFIEFQNQNLNIMYLDTKRSALTPEQNNTYTRLQRKVALLTELFKTISNRYEIARIDAKEQDTRIEILEYAVPPEFPDGTNLVLVICIGGVLGFFFSLYLSFVFEYLSRKHATGRIDPIIFLINSDIKKICRIFRRQNN